MSIHVCKCGNEWHLRYPGLSEAEAQSIADKINLGALTSGETLQRQVAMLHGVIAKGADTVIANYSMRIIPLEAALTVLSNTRATSEAYVTGLKKAFVYEGYSNREQEVRDLLGIDGNTDSRLEQLTADMKYLSLYSSYVYKCNKQLDEDADRYVDECLAAELRATNKEGE